MHGKEGGIWSAGHGNGGRKLSVHKKKAKGRKFYRVRSHTKFALFGPPCKPMCEKRNINQFKRMSEKGGSTPSTIASSTGFGAKVREKCKDGGEVSVAR